MGAGLGVDEDARGGEAMGTVTADGISVLIVLGPYAAGSGLAPICELEASVIQTRSGRQARS
jgi:hypothetical protein